MSFISGSRSYGTPRSDSDVDLVVLVSPLDADIIRSLAGCNKLDEPVKFGRLNLILMESELEMAVWYVATEQCRKIAPLDREAAKKVINALQKSVGLSDRRRSD